MAIDVLTFLRYMNEQTGPKTDPLGNPGLDVVAHQQEQNKQNKDSRIQEIKQEAHDNHVNNVHSFLAKKGFKLVDLGLNEGGKVRLLGDSKIKLNPGEYAFFHPSSGRSDLEVNHNGKIVKVELKGKWVGDQHQSQYHYNFPYQKPITIKTPHGDMTISPSEFAQRVKARSGRTVSVYSMSNREVFNILGDAIQDKLHEKLKSIPIETPNGTVNINLRDLRAGKLGTLPFSYYKQIQEKLYGTVPVGRRGRGIRRRILGRGEETSLVTQRPRTLSEYAREVLSASMPSILGSLDSHVSIAGNGSQITIGHHRQRCEENSSEASCEERKSVEEFLKHVNLMGTHEPTDISLARSPTTKKELPEGEQDEDDVSGRGSTGNFGLSHATPKDRTLKAAVMGAIKRNALEIHGESGHVAATEEAQSHAQRRKEETKLKKSQKETSGNRIG